MGWCDGMMAVVVYLRVRILFSVKDYLGCGNWVQKVWGEYTFRTDDCNISFCILNLGSGLKELKAYPMLSVQYKHLSVSLGTYGAHIFH